MTHLASCLDLATALFDDFSDVHDLDVKKKHGEMIGIMKPFIYCIGQVKKNGTWYKVI